MQSPVNMQYGNYAQSSASNSQNTGNTMGTITPFIMPSYQKGGMPPLSMDDQSGQSLTENSDKNGYITGSDNMRQDLSPYAANVHYNYQASYGNHSRQLPVSPADDDGIYGPGDE